jgi:hypothetical protein
MKRIIMTMLTAFSLVLGGQALQPAAAYAATPCPTNDTPKGQVLSGVDQTGDCDGSGVTNMIRAVIRVLSIIVGIAAVIMIIVSGYKYIVSGGDSGKISSAKQTLIYALVGLVIVALSQLLIHFVLTQSRTATFAPCPEGQHRSADGQDCVRN